MKPEYEPRKPVEEDDSDISFNPAELEDWPEENFDAEKTGQGVVQKEQEVARKTIQVHEDGTVDDDVDPLDLFVESYIKEHPEELPFRGTI